MIPKISVGVLENFRDNLGPDKAKKLINILKEEDEGLFEHLMDTAKEMADVVNQLDDDDNRKRFVIANTMYICSALRKIIDTQIEVQELEEIYG